MLELYIEIIPERKHVIVVMGVCLALIVSEIVKDIYS